MQDGNNINDYPVTRANFVNGWNTFGNGTNTLRDWRNAKLAYCITGMLHVAKSQLEIKLNSTNAANIGISSKMYPYYFPKAPSEKSDEFRGYDNAQLGWIISQSNKFLAIDAYPTTEGLTSDFDTTRIRTNPSLVPNPSKKIYLAEFNRNYAGYNIPLTTQEVFDSGKIGFDSKDLGYFLFFAWNPTGAGYCFKMTEGQKLGLYNLFNYLAPKTNLAEADSTLSGKPNNFASGAFGLGGIGSGGTITYSGSISRTDVDWFKFTNGTKTFYLKIVQQSDLTNPDVAKTYGLQLFVSSCGILSAKTYNLGKEIDTKLFLYDSNLVEMASNDDYAGYKTFSKLYFNLNDTVPSYVSNTPTSSTTKKMSLNTTDADANVNITKQEVNSLSEVEEQFNVIVSPNPIVNYLNVSVIGLEENYNILMTDLNGKKVYLEKNITESKKTIDMSSINEGVYCLIISTNKDKKVKKIIKLTK